MSHLKVVVHGLVNLLRVLIGSLAALLSFIILGVFFLDSFGFTGLPWYKVLFYSGFTLVVGSLFGSLAYGLLFMRHWVLCVIRAIFVGILLWCLAYLVFGPNPPMGSVFDSDIWVTGMGMLLPLFLLDVLLRKHHLFPAKKRDL